ncbi:HDIG domain-containing metalloprotein [Gimesia sp.]|uniref:HD family phosphohydrolase n=1 Tax=Gimesia sp. TaxID=2024833 RepID=UPI000C43DEAB|nr:HDIG domain-containing metalloprotein [Gimesia sp.]MAX40451.1 phosphohydrolase [Gimesia sp.]HBL48594.1 phosphohydrolase [Planctomycetaceae bacterium]|tara:strand:- start:2421 stop:4745 length:2325 start_codon:yes stop_codon:yes gene_type:complete
MAFFGSKKSRTALAASLRDSSKLSSRLRELLSNRGTASRLSVCLLTILILMVAVESWRAPFPYRLGMFSEHGIVASSSFKVSNPIETDRERTQQESQVPYYFKQQPELIEKKLPGLLRDDLIAIANARSLDELDPDSRAELGLTSSRRLEQFIGQLPEEPEQTFAELKSLVSSPDSNDTKKIEELVADFKKLISPLATYGIVNENDLTQNQIRADDNITIINEGTGKQLEVTTFDIRLPNQLSENGVIGREWKNFPRLAPLSAVLSHWIHFQAPTTLVYNSERTIKERNQARNQVEEIFDTFQRGTILVEPGQLIDDNQLALLRAEYEAKEKAVPSYERAIRVTIIFLMLVVLAVLNGYHLLRNKKAVARTVSRLSIYLSVIILTIFLARLLSYDPWRAEVLPLVVTVMVFAIVYDQMMAILTALSLSLVLCLSTGAPLGNFVVLMSVSAVAVTSLANVSSRSTLIKLGFGMGLTYFLVYWGINLINNQVLSNGFFDQQVVWESLQGAGWCLAAGYLVAGSLPFVESLFGVVTDISLLEMSNVSHPLLQELVRRAPGTYNHSISVATIGEAAADKIGANGLLVRVAAYYHDIGKMLKPQYFIENMAQGSESLHDNLAPAMSTLIIIGHVKDGVDLARQHNLPQPIIDFIEQHHGTTLVEYFFREAEKQADLSPDHKTDAEESSFRYPGPRPQTREAGVMMLSDAVESASRTLSDPTPKRIKSLVHSLVMKRLLDGQFNECSLTLSEINIVEESLVKSLIGIYHGRIKYPEERSA